jgi:predicted N-acyltransferase
VVLLSTAAASASPSWEVRTHAAPADVDAQDWNALLAQCEQPTPFMRHEWLTALHESGCAAPDTGWVPLLLTAHRSDEPETIAGACVAYVKSHSYGEYVFDWAWADAHQRAGLPYYPKLLCASPFTPVPGSRLLAREPAARAALLSAMSSLAERMGGSSAHLLFPDEDDLKAAREAGWLIRQGVQFHWENRHASSPGELPYVDMADFLAALNRDKRKKIQQERRRVADAGVTVRTLRGPHITASDWDFFFRCYRQTYLAHGAPPYLSPEFFQKVARTLPEHWLMFVAERDGSPVAASLLGIDGERGVAWGRYWGALEHIPCLHFELCYYAPLAWCIEQGFVRFEGGAQGEHKMARGLLPVTTWSAHWLRDPRFADAVARYLDRECAGLDAYLDELHERRPFKSP